MNYASSSFIAPKLVFACFQLENRFFRFPTKRAAGLGETVIQVFGDSSIIWSDTIEVCKLLHRVEWVQLMVIWVGCTLCVESFDKRTSSSSWSDRMTEQPLRSGRPLFGELPLCMSEVHDPPQRAAQGSAYRSSWLSWGEDGDCGSVVICPGEELCMRGELDLGMFLDVIIILRPEVPKRCFAGWQSLHYLSGLQLFFKFNFP